MSKLLFDWSLLAHDVVVLSLLWTSCCCTIPIAAVRAAGVVDPTTSWHQHADRMVPSRLLHNEAESVKQTESRQFELWEPKDIRETIKRWTVHYPKFIHATTAQEKYGLPTAGGSDDCPFDTEGPGCLNQIIWLQDFEAHPVDSKSSKRLPEVLWSGELHGDEQVGPTATLEAVDMLLEAAMCESMPRMALKAVAGTWEVEVERSRACRDDLAQKGIDHNHRRWLARLLTTRRLVVIPTANALGYYRKNREENNIDPNRDFPYDQDNPTKCMQTIAGRTLNEVFRDHMFQLSLTFHGGMEVVGYEWGAPYWNRDSSEPRLSPDDTAQKQIAAAYSQYAGGWSTTRPYNYGPYVFHLFDCVFVCFAFLNQILMISLSVRVKFCPIR